MQVRITVAKEKREELTFLLNYYGMMRHSFSSVGDKFSVITSIQFASDLEKLQAGFAKHLNPIIEAAPPKPSTTGEAL